MSSAAHRSQDQRQTLLPAGRLLFLHLADIHFHKKSGDIFDLDEQLRNELGRDAGKVIAKLGPATGILVCGDIAFAGQASEYLHAKTWLAKLSGIACCPESSVWVVPGNHDVDRGTIRDSDIVQQLRNYVRNSGKQSGETLARQLQDKQADETILSPLKEYNNFSRNYDCAIHARKPFWKDDLPLNDGSILRLWGLTSVLISDAKDHEHTGKLILGEFQTRILREDGVEYLTLSHHPPSWLLDADKVEDALNTLTRVQLYGHKHRQRMMLIKTGEHQSLRLTAGAVHPERDEDWEPRYNFLALHTEGIGTERVLVLTVYPRRWDPTLSQFRADATGGTDHQVHRLLLDPWTPPPAPATMPPREDSMRSSPEAVSAPAVPSQSACAPSPPVRSIGGDMSARRQLLYRFYGLPYETRLRIVLDLGLMTDADRDLSELALFEQCLERARARSLLGRLWEAVGLPAPNPFDKP